MNKHQRTLYDTCRRLSADTSSEFYWKGQPRRGATHRAAYWSGRAGMPPPPGCGRESLTWACYRAGQDDRKADVRAGNAMPEWGLVGNYWQLPHPWSPKAA